MFNCAAILPLQRLGLAHFRDERDLSGLVQPARVFEPICKLYGTCCLSSPLFKSTPPPLQNPKPQEPWDVPNRKSAASRGPTPVCQEGRSPSVQMAFPAPWSHLEVPKLPIRLAGIIIIIIIISIAMPFGWVGAPEEFVARSMAAQAHHGSRQPFVFCLCRIVKRIRSSLSFGGGARKEGDVRPNSICAAQGSNFQYRTTSTSTSHSRDAPLPASNPGVHRCGPDDSKWLMDDGVVLEPLLGNRAYHRRFLVSSVAMAKCVFKSPKMHLARFQKKQPKLCHLPKTMLEIGVERCQGTFGSPFSAFS